MRERELFSAEERGDTRGGKHATPTYRLCIFVCVCACVCVLERERNLSIAFRDIMSFMKEEHAFFRLFHLTMQGAHSENNSRKSAL